MPEEGQGHRAGQESKVKKQRNGHRRYERRQQPYGRGARLRKDHLETSIAEVRGNDKQAQAAGKEKQESVHGRIDFLQRVGSDGPHVVRKYPVARRALFKTSQDACLANLLVAN
jgi:hypothetical protein